MRTQLVRYLSKGTLVLAAVVGVLGAGAARAQSQTVTIDTFGLHIHGIARGADWPDVRFGYLRLWDANVTWADLEPTKGNWSFERLDRYVSLAEQHNVKLILTLGQVPAWAASDPRSKSPYGPGANTAPTSIADWENYVATLGRRYKGRIKVWEIWNEINVAQFWHGPMDKMVELENSAARVLKGIDSQNVVLSPSIQGGAFKQLNDYFAAGGGKAADAIGYHFYAVTEEPEALVDRVRRVREAMSKHGLQQKAIWNTEIGWLIPNQDGGFGARVKPQWSNWRRPSAEEAAGFVIRSYLLLLASGVQTTVWYAWDDGALGLAEQQGRLPKQAARAFVKTQEWLLGSQVRECAETGAIWVCTASRDGRTVRFVWSQTERDFEIPSNWGIARVEGPLGARDGPSSGRIRIGPVPLLLN